MESQPFIADVPARPRPHRLAGGAFLLCVGCTLALARQFSSPAVAPTTTSLSAVVVDDDALSYFESLGCSYEDDDAFFLSDHGCITGDASTCKNFLTTNSKLNGSAVPFFGANESCSAACSSELDRTWGVPCAWQLIANLPSACNSSFTPNVTALLESSNLAPNATAQSKRAHFYQVYDEGKKEAKQYDCNLHAFCSACSDGAGGVNAYCAATVMYYNSFILDAHVLMYADDFWCRADVLGSIAKGLDTFVADFGIHKHWWNRTNSAKGI